MQREQLLALGLETDPFAPAAESFSGFLGDTARRPPPYFATPALGQRLDLAHHLIAMSDHLLLVRARPGMGKSAWLDQLASRQSEHWRVVRVDCSGPLGARALLEQLVGGLGLSRDDVTDRSPEGRLARLAEYLEASAREGDLTAVLVDDADRLDPGGLELVLELASRSESLKARLVLAGPPELQEKVAAAASAVGSSGALRNLLHPIELNPFAEGETGDYLQTRMIGAGMQGDSPFSTEAVAEIHRRSGGVPGEINRLAREHLLRVAHQRAQLARRGAFWGQLSRWWKGFAVTAFGLAILLVVVLLLPSSPPREGPLATPPVIVDLHPDRVGAPAARPPAGAPSGPTPSPAGPPEVPATSGVGTASAGSPAPAPGGTPGTTPTGGGAELARASTDGGSSGRVPDGGTRPASPGEAPRGPAALPADRPAVASPGAPAGSPSPSPEVVPPDPPVAASPGAGTPARSAAAPSPQAAGSSDGSERPARRPPPGPVVHGVAWLRTQNPDHYTVQLVGTHSEQSLRTFLRSVRLDRDLAWVRTSRDRRPWFVVVYGIFPDRAAALAAVEGLPRTVRRTNPFPRRVSSLVRRP